MYQVKLYNKIAKAGTDLLDSKQFCYGEDVENYDAILVRSAKLHDVEFPKSLKCIARAGAGVNNIPLDICSEKGIVVFNTPGANANAVKELVLGALFMSSRKILSGYEWTKTLAGNGDQIGALAEKGKSNFAGPEISGKTLGVIGLGAIGLRVANAAISLGMDVVGYDPYLSVDAALQIKREVSYTTNLDEVFAKADYITVHVPLMDATRGIVGEESIQKMKDGVRILNFARGGLCDEAAVIAALKSGKVACYMTDFASEELLEAPNAYCFPHLGASTPESEENCARMATQEMIDYLEKGNIRNSVNYPNLKVPFESDNRICIMHRNVPNMIANLSTLLSAHGANIENVGSRSRGDYAYTIIETKQEVPESLLNLLRSNQNVAMVRLITK
ncbi:MAG: 3-phosphoglycerate dehydrogenase family protein [Eubacteriales bacterium]|nr:3-phosphoglycerate dehydrogenase family protein [Eubacteriales bacterium]